MSDIYSTVPAKNLKQMPDDLKKKLLEYLKKQPDVFTTAKKIAVDIGYPTRGTQAELRKAITELIEETGIPIIATAKGFAYTEDIQKVLEYVKSLELRRRGLNRRIQALQKYYQARFEQDRINKRFPTRYFE